MDKKPEVTQAMISAYDEYTHLHLDRRKFMERLTVLAGSGAAAAAIAPMLAASGAQAAVVAVDDDRLTTKSVVFPGANGEMKGYWARPKSASGPLGSIIVIHENRGLNEHIRDVARRAALEGFNALAVDFLSPVGGTPPDEDKAREMFSTLDAAKTAADGEAARVWLAKHEGANGKVGAVGFCWGGGLVNRMAVNSPELNAGVAYYGQQAPAADVPKIKAPLMLHYGGLDERINAGIPAYREALEKDGKTFEIFVYEGVNHAFNNDTSSARYDKAAADLAWSRTTEFFKKNLG
ncbi:dienelactone hydrolase family protein [Rhizobiales bacterium RZME27]|uniref:Dienelactone hydrolase family protein n=1 Tax=Endobacterium cereale TaxID=2663029 RepID=A0A6A8ADD8_9HYPH|nr:dienelactone hydrolase family protein [Endobacterium cereale]MEB2846828.1 dienelactone hydrolase family protein [Endobacterium cereale]MQY47750.1 dienelactone hydrolase family protein [Endobacterium cereale]